MKTLSSLWVVLAMVTPVAALAETVGIRSGDHNGFTRLVVQFAEQENWTFGRVDGGFELRPGRDDIAYRLDRVYDKIGRQRISDIRDLGDGRLFLAVDCNCHGVVDELASGEVVLDIVAGPAADPGTGTDAGLPDLADAAEINPGGEQPADRAEASVGPALTDVPTREPVIVSDRAGLPLILPRSGLPVMLLDRMAAAQPHRALEEGSTIAPGGDAVPPAAPEAHTAAEDLSEAPQPDRATRIAETETVLLEQIARAAAQGLLDADLGAVEQGVAEARPQPDEAPPPPEIARPLPPAVPRGHIAVETSVDRAGAGRAPNAVETAEGDACIDPAYFDVAAWGGDVSNGTNIGAYRSRIVGEFDIANGAGLTALARNYVYITFGAEAKALLRRYPDAVERADLLFAMAEVMDAGQSSAAQDLVDQMTCDGPTALWATLAQPDLRPGQAINREAVALAFAALPPHLRGHLGPGLADKLLAAGDGATADVVRAAIDRAHGAPSSEYGMLTARFDLDAGEVGKATATLDEVIAAGDASMPEALLQRVEATLASGSAVPEDMIVLLDGLVFQYRGSETARRTADAGIRARASAGAFADALAQLDAAAEAGLFPPERGAALFEAVFEQLVQDTSDTEFLRLSLPRLDATTRLSPAARRALATRLIDLGFAGPGREALGDQSGMPAPADRRLLARAALIEGKPAVAIGYLAGLDDEAALSIRAEALDMARDYAGATRAHEQAGDEAERLQSAWRGGLWPEVARLDHGPIGAAALLMADDAAHASGDQAENPREHGEGSQRPPMARAFVPGAPSSLAAAQALVAESAATRQALTALFDSIPVQATGLTASAGVPDH